MNLFNKVMAEAASRTVSQGNSQGMLPNGRAATNSTVRASVTDLENPDGHLATQDVLDEGVKILGKIARDAGNTTQEMLTLFRKCGNIAKATGSFAFIERTFCDKLSEQSIEDGFGKITTTKSAAKYLGLDRLQWDEVKSKLIMFANKCGDYRKSMQDLANQKEKLNGDPRVDYPEDWMNPFADRYGDEKKGATRLYREYRMSLQAPKDEAKLLDAHKRAQAKQAQAALNETTARQGASEATNGPDAGIRGATPGRQGKSELHPDIAAALWTLTHVLHNISLEADVVISALKECSDKLAEADRARKVGNSPSDAALADYDARMAKFREDDGSDDAIVDAAEQGDGEEWPELTEHDQDNIDDIEAQA